MLDQHLNLNLEQLADSISASVTALTEFASQTGQTLPTFAADSTTAPPSIGSVKATKARENLVSAARQILYLALGPTDALNWQFSLPLFDVACLNWICHFGIPQAVPLEGTVTFSDIAFSCGVDENQVTRFLRHAMTNFWFREPDHGRVAHTSLSAQLATNKAVQAQLQWTLKYHLPSAFKLVEATEKAKHAPGSTAFGLAFSTSMISPQYASSDPTRAQMYSEFTAVFQHSSTQGVHHLVNGYDWNALGAAHVVDVGGNTGDTAIALARAAPSLRLTVQDLPETIEIGRAKLQNHLKERITLQAHDFLTSNPISGADIYLLRSILHDWPDSRAMQIMQNLVPCMNDRSRILIVDTASPARSKKGTMQDKIVRHQDLMMLATCGAQERTEEEWKDLIVRAHTRLKVERISRPAGSVMSIIEVVKIADYIVNQSRNATANE